MMADEASTFGARPEPRDRRPALHAAVLACAAVAIVTGFGVGISSDERAEPARGSLVGKHAAMSESVEALSPTIVRLNARRAAGRERLQDARRPAGQAAAARDVSEAYRTARRSLAEDAGPATAAVSDALGDAEAGYGALAAAALRGDVKAYRRARSAVLRRERELSALLRRLPRP